MLIPISSIVVNDRIRKDFGDIEELAGDIKENGLINPVLINQDNVLIAGERRYRACKSLGWTEIEVHQMSTRDAEHELNIEISENEVRKGFSKKERADYMKRLMRIESAKAKENSLNNLVQNQTADVQNSAPRGKTRNIVASQFGVSHDTMEKEITIVDHKELLDPSDFADWDEGKLSTNKTYIKLKEKLKELEEEKKQSQAKLQELEAEKYDLEQENTSLQGELASIDSDSDEELREQLEEVKGQLDEALTKVKALESREPKMVEVEVEKEVIIHADERELAEKDARIKELEEKVKALSEPETLIDLPDIDSPNIKYGSFISAFRKFNSTAAYFQPSPGGFDSLDKTMKEDYLQIVTQIEGLAKRMRNCLPKE